MVVTHWVWDGTGYTVEDKNTKAKTNTNPVSPGVNLTWTKTQSKNTKTHTNPASPGVNLTWTFSTASSVRFGQDAITEAASSYKM